MLMLSYRSISRVGSEIEILTTPVIVGIRVVPCILSPKNDSTINIGEYIKMNCFPEFNDSFLLKDKCPD
jgi:hypothetical protein